MYFHSQLNLLQDYEKAANINQIQSNLSIINKMFYWRNN